MKNSFIFLFLVTFSSALFFQSCNPSIIIIAKRPAEVNLKNYKKIAIGSIIDPSGRESGHSQDIVDDLTAKLFDSKAFEVVDRQNLDKILKELNLGQSGLVDENSASEIGKILGSAVMVFGRLQNDSYKEIRSVSEYNDDKGKKHKTYKCEGTLTFIINLKLIDVKTSKILAIRTLNGSSSETSKGFDQAAPEIDQNNLYINCKNSVISQFMRVIAPYEVNLQVVFQKDAKLPELEQALTQIKIKEWDTAVKLLADATTRQDLVPKVKAKAYYNYGLILNSIGKFDEAINNFNDAMKLMPNITKYQEAIVTAKEDKARDAKLKEQQ